MKQNDYVSGEYAGSYAVDGAVWLPVRVAEND